MVSKLKKRFQNFIKNVRGAILIEFAVCMPILILLLLGLHDVFRMARMQDQSNFVAHEIVQMIQNISQSRSNKKITKEDLADVCRFACYTIYPGKTLYATSDRHHVYSHFPWITLHYVKGESEGKASVVWRAVYTTQYLYQNFGPVRDSVTGTEGLVRVLQNAEPSSIYPALTISEGEVKIIVQVAFLYDYYPNSDIFPSIKQAFGLYLLKPAYGGGAFRAIAIFTPKRGLFDESGPPNASAITP